MLHPTNKPPWKSCRPRRQSAILNEILQNELKPIRERREAFAGDIGAVFDMLKAGSEKARAVAADTLSEVKAAMGIDYFGKNALTK